MVTLSILVISHNQREQLRRCVESILSQALPFEYEVVISDDSSSDGTWELAEEFASKHQEVSAFRCNSDDCKPTITSERSGHNRSNAFSHSMGKYFVHIDADDFYRPGTDCLKKQVELLEDHPECSLCMQNDWCWNEGDPLDVATTTHKLHRFKTGEIVTAEYYFREHLFINNGVMMMRRQHDANPAELYHKWYVDSIITEHYLQYGPIVCLDRNDWVYSQTPGSITSSLNSNDQMVMWPLDLTVFSSMLIPSLSPLYYTDAFILRDLLDAVRIILRKSLISDSMKQYFAEFQNLFIYRCAASETLSVVQKGRLYVIRNYIKRLLHREDISLKALKRLDRMLTWTF